MVERHPTTYLQAAAWVPFDLVTPWEDAAAVAAEWIWQRSNVEGVDPALVTNTLRGGVLLPVLAEIGRCGHASPQSKQRLDLGPVLAYVPDKKALIYAMDLARGYSLVVVEGSNFKLAEWAAGAAAIDLLTDQQTSSSLTSEVLKDLDSVIFFGGNNGWTGSHEKDHARRRLSAHAAGGLLTGEQAAAYVMSQGVSDRGATRLKRLLEAKAKY